MRIQIRNQGAQADDQTRHHLERQLLFALGRFQSRIRSVMVRLNDANGPKGGVDQECRIAIDAGHRSPIIVSERDSDVRAAIARASDRAARAVARHMSLRTVTRTTG